LSKVAAEQRADLIT